MPPAKNFLVPVNGALKWLSFEKSSVKNLRPYHLGHFSLADKAGAKMTELRKII